MADILPLRRQSNPIPEAPPIHSHRRMEVFHYLLPPDEFGDALVAVAPSCQLQGRWASEIADMIEVSRALVARNDDWFFVNKGDGHYLNASFLLNGDPIFVYVTFMLITPPGDWRH